MEVVKEIAKERKGKYANNQEHLLAHGMNIMPKNYLK
jgi:hypothetical protein